MKIISDMNSKIKKNRNSTFGLPNIILLHTVCQTLDAYVFVHVVPLRPPTPPTQPPTPPSPTPPSFDDIQTRGKTQKQISDEKHFQGKFVRAISDENHFQGEFVRNLFGICSGRAKVRGTAGKKRFVRTNSEQIICSEFVRWPGGPRGGVGAARGRYPMTSKIGGGGNGLPGPVFLIHRKTNEDPRGQTSIAIAIST